jgi:hypothetical protein
MTGLVYAIAGLFVTAALGGLAWLIRDWLRIRAGEGAKDQAIAAKEETVKRILREKDAEEQIHRDRPGSVADAIEQLRDL